MGILSVNKTYEDNQILGEINLDNAFDSIEAFINTGSISGENIQDNSITSAEIQTSAITEVKIADNAVSTNKIADGAVTLAKLAADIANRLVPVSRVSAYAGDSAPTGWLMCDGVAVSRTTYAALFAVVGVRFGSGDGTTTFNTPDLRGRFIRGRDNATGRDPDAAARTAMNTGGATGDNVGSVQLDDWKWTEGRVMNSTLGGPTGNRYAVGGGGGALGSIAIGSSDASKTGLETRPKNVNMNFIIKV